MAKLDVEGMVPDERGIDGAHAKGGAESHGKGGRMEASGMMFRGMGPAGLARVAPARRSAWADAKMPNPTVEKGSWRKDCAQVKYRPGVLRDAHHAECSEMALNCLTITAALVHGFESAPSRVLSDVS